MRFWSPKFAQALRCRCGKASKAEHRLELRREGSVLETQAESLARGGIPNHVLNTGIGRSEWGCLGQRWGRQYSKAGDSIRWF